MAIVACSITLRVAVDTTIVHDKLELVAYFDEHFCSEALGFLVVCGLDALTPRLLLRELAEYLNLVVLVQTLMMLAARGCQLQVQTGMEVTFAAEASCLDDILEFLQTTNDDGSASLSFVHESLLQGPLEDHVDAKSAHDRPRCLDLTCIRRVKRPHHYLSLSLG